MKRFEYYAFISYSREDEKWAKWLQNKLENYRVPESVVQDSDGRIPQYIRPVFRDKTDISIGDIQQTLRSELEDSRFLIVICSPNGAKSKWVDREVEYFKQLGRGDRIIPLIVEGSPSPDGKEKQCYPPSLDKNMLGASLSELSREQALIKIVASILGLKFDELFKRHVRRDRKKKKINYSLIAGLLLVLIAGSVYYWDYQRLKVRFYADYVEKWGVPEGIYPLSKRDIRGREYHYRFEYQKRRLQRVVTANSAGFPGINTVIEYNDRPMIQEFHYLAGKRELDYVDYLNRNNKVLLRKEYSGEDLTVVDFTFADKLNRAATLTANTSSVSSGFFNLNQPYIQRSDISRHLIKRDAKGYVKKIRFMRDNRNTPVGDASGIFGRQYIRDQLGRITDELYLNIDGEIIENKLGISRIKMSFNEEGSLVRTEYRNTEGNYVLNDLGYAIGEMEFDDRQNPVRGSYYGIDKEPINSKGENMGFASFIRLFDERGYLVRLSFFGTDGNPCFDSHGIASYQYENDEKGRPVRTYAYDTAGNLALSKYGTSEVQSKYDKYGNITQATFFDTDGAPVLSNQGTAGWRARYNDQGDMIEYTVFDTTGHPSIDQVSYVASTSYEYDEYGNLIKEAYFGPDRKPCLNNLGVAGYTAKYDAKGNQTEFEYFDTHGRPALEKTSLVNKQVIERDKWGNITKISNYGSDGKPCIYRESTHSWLNKYDDSGNLIESANYNVNGKLALNPSTLAAIIQYQFNGVGNNTRITYLGLDGQPVISKDGYAIWEAKYDNQSRKIEETYRDKEGKLCLEKGSHVAKVAYEYDQRGNNVKSLAFGTDGQLKLGGTKSAIIETKYDRRNNPVQVNYYGTDGSPCLNHFGYSIVKRKFNEKGQTTQEAYFDTSGNPVLNNQSVASWTAKYDQKGHQIEIVYFDKQGHPCLLQAPENLTGNQTNNDNFNFAKQKNEFNEKGQLLRTLYYDVDNQLSIYAGNGPGIEYEYDDFNNLVRSTYLGLDLKPRNTKGCATTTYEYDERGNNTQKRFFDEKGLPCLEIGGSFSAGINIKYDSLNRPVEYTYWDVDERPRLVHGTSKTTMEYDERGNLNAQYYYGPDGRPALYTSPSAPRSNFSGWKAVYNIQDNRVEERFFGLDGKLTLTRDGYAMIKYTYDDKGITEVRYFDHRERPCTTSWGSSIQEYFYDERGNLTIVKEYDAKEEPVDGIHTYKYIYDQNEKLVQTLRYDKTGKLQESKSLIIIGDVVPGSPGSSVGIMVNDYVFQWGDWKFDINLPFGKTAVDFGNALKEYQDQTKVILLVRMNPNGTGKVLRFELPPGRIGARLLDMTHDVEYGYQVQAVFNTWKMNNPE